MNIFLISERLLCEFSGLRVKPPPPKTEVYRVAVLRSEMNTTDQQYSRIAKGNDVHGHVHGVEAEQK